MAVAGARAPVGANNQGVSNGAQNDEGFEGEGADLGFDEGLEGEDDATDPTLNLGTEQTPGGEEDLDPDGGDDGADFFPPPQPTRGQSRQQRLANEAKDLRAQLADIQKRLTPQPTPQPTYTGPQEETDEQFQARIQLLPPDERVEAKLDRQQRVFQRQNAITQFQAAELSDKTTFDAKCVADKRYARWAPRVEEKRTELMRQGQVVPREHVLRWLLGDRMLSPEGQRESDRQTRRSRERVDRQTVRPSNNRGDVAPNRRGQQSEAQARARRLDGIQI